MSQKLLRNFDADETARLQALDGVTLASFRSRAAAFLVDYFLAFGMFLAIVKSGAKLLEKLGFAISDMNLPFNFEHWYSILFLVIFFALSTYWGNGKTLGKWMFGIRIVSLTHERMSL